MRVPGRLRSYDDAGMTLVEIMFALVIATGVLLALALATIAGVRGTLLARQNQLAADMVNQSIEKVRALDFADVSLVTGDPTLSGDARIVGGKFDPGTGTAETVIFVSVGTLNPHITSETRNGTTYSLARYVTQPAGLTTGTRRVTSVVTWQAQGKTHVRTSSTFVTATRRGLPLPRFLLQFSSASAQSKGSGTTATFGLRLKNYGARDAWNITGPAGTWSYVVDDDRDGTLDVGETTAVTDSDSDGKLDTGFVEVNKEVFLLASTTVPGSVGSTFPYAWTFRSVAQPAAASAAQSLSGSVTVSGTPSASPSATPSPSPSATPSATPTSTPGPAQNPWPIPVASCAGACTLLPEYLHELPVGSHANSGSNSTTFDSNSTLQATLNNYSIGSAGSAGRFVGIGGAVTTETNRDKVADWRRQANVRINVKAGQAVVTLYVACVTGSSPLTLDVAIGSGVTTALSSFTNKGTGNATLTTCTGTFQPLTIAITISSAFTVNKNAYLVLRAAVPSTMASAVRIGYDAVATPSTVVIPQ